MLITRKRLLLLALCCFVLAIGIFMFSHFLYHYITADFTVSPVYLTEMQKPMVTWLFAIWGAMFLFAGMFRFLAALIFFPWGKKK